MFQTLEKESTQNTNIFAIWQSCPPSGDEILSSLRKQYERLSRDYGKLQKLNDQLKKRHIQESNNGKIKCLKRQRSYLGRFNLYTGRPQNLS